MSELANRAWSSFNPVHVVGGASVRHYLSRLVPQTGPVLLVTTKGFTRRGVTDSFRAEFGERLHVFDAVTPNPQLDDLDCLADQLRCKSFASIIAVGGGSVLDTGKVLSVLLRLSEPRVLDSVLRGGRQLKWKSGVPLIAIPTTAGTGAEVTPFATVWDRLTASKYSVSGDAVFPAFACLDPTLTLGLPRSETLYSGLDAISHALESIWNRNKTAVTEAYAMQALEILCENLPVVLANPESVLGREKMQQASLLGGFAISGTRTAIAHSISYPVTSSFGVPHGLACSFTLPGIIEMFMKDVQDSRTSDLLSRTHGMLLGLELSSEMRKFVDVDTLPSKVDSMFHKDRIDNFSMPISRDQVLDLLGRSV